MNLKSCEELAGNSRQRKICDGTSGLPLVKTNLYRAMWGLPPLEVTEVPLKESIKSTLPTKPNAADSVAGGGCCGGKRKTLASKAVSFMTAIAKWTANGWQKTSPEVKSARLAVCQSCPFYDNGECADCGCVLKVKTAMDTEVCPLGKWSRSVPPLKTQIGNPVRHLLYHIYPVAFNGNWKWNIAQLLKRIELFDGVRSIAIATDGRTVSADEVQREFRGTRIDNWIIRKNDSKRREGTTFVDLLNTLPRDDGIVFYAHAKGVRHAETSGTLGWAEMMYEVCLDDMSSILNHLAAFPMVGAFKRYGEFKLDKNHQWHYSGTFYWFRSRDVFAKPRWGFLQPNFFACVEAWPANLFEAHETSCIFGENAGSLYDAPELQKWSERLLAWRKARECRKY